MKHHIAAAEPVHKAPQLPVLPAPQEVLDEAVAAARECSQPHHHSSKYRYPIFAYSLDAAMAALTWVHVIPKPTPPPKPLSPEAAKQLCVNANVDKVLGEPDNSVVDTQQLQQVRNYVITRLKPASSR